MLGNRAILQPALRLSPATTHGVRKAAPKTILCSLGSTLNICGDFQLADLLLIREVVQCFFFSRTCNQMTYYAAELCEAHKLQDSLIFYIYSCFYSDLLLIFVLFFFIGFCAKKLFSTTIFCLFPNIVLFSDNIVFCYV